MNKKTIDYVMASQALAELDRIAAAHPELVCHDGDRWEDNIGMLLSALDGDDYDDYED